MKSSKQEPTVVVGIDGSAGSAVALRWAIDHADHLGALTPVMAYADGLYAHGYGAIEASGGSEGHYRAEAAHHLTSFLEEHAAELGGAGLVVEGRAGAALVESAAGSELLVVGTRGWSTRVDVSLGSTGAYCARHSTVPVALIPEEVPALHEHLEVVVGFDGSPHARNALRWTLTHLRHSAKVTAVRVFTEESVVGEPLSPDPGISWSNARDELERGVAWVLRDLDPHPPVELLVLPGDPRAALRTACDEADILVVGARGHGVLDRLLLGSVASALVHHPTIPTIVVAHRHESAVTNVT